VRLYYSPRVPGLPLHRALLELVSVMSLSEAKRYHAYARECLRLAEASDKSDDRERLLELSRVWMEAALVEERHALENSASKSTA
jgi:hypothetical protein